jgi:hypothetical protein
VGGCRVVQIGGDLRLADRDPRRLPTAVMPVSVNQPHRIASIRALAHGFFTQLTIWQAYPK